MSIIGEIQVQLGAKESSQYSEQKPDSWQELNFDAGKTIRGTLHHHCRPFMIHNIVIFEQHLEHRDPRDFLVLSSCVILDAYAADLYRRLPGPQR